MDVSIIIVNWNTGTMLRDCIRSIAANSQGIKCEIIVVDNNSTDDSLTLVEEMNQENIKILKLKSNMGFSYANNEGVRISRGHYILFLNPDTLFVDENTITKMIKQYNDLSKNESIGILAPQLLNDDGTVQHSVQYYPVFNISTLIRKIVISLSPRLKLRGTANPQEIDWARGACFFLDRSVGEKLGFWDEDFHLYGEDLELCYRYASKGYKTYFCPAIKIIHHYNQSASKRWSDIQILIRKEESLRLFYKKNLGLWKFFLFEFLTLARLSGRVLMTRNPKERELLKMNFKAKLHVLSGKN